MRGGQADVSSSPAKKLFHHEILSNGHFGLRKTLGVNPHLLHASTTADQDQQKLTVDWLQFDSLLAVSEIGVNASSRNGSHFRQLPCEISQLGRSINETCVVPAFF